MGRDSKYRETLIVIDFVAYGKHKTEFFFDQTYKQATEYIWENICPTANVLFAWQYGVTEPVQIKITKRKLTDEELEKKYKKF